MQRLLSCTLCVLLLTWTQAAQAQPRVTVDAEAREVRVPAEALVVDMPLEFVCVVIGTADHESLLRTPVAPSQIHAALLGLGLEPGRPLRYSEAADRWLAPSGPPVRIDVEWQDAEGNTVRERVGRLLKNVETGQSMPPRRFVFVGSRLYGDGLYAADATGQVVSLVNFESPVVDVAELASNANELLEWVVDTDVAPPMGTLVTMILMPVGDDGDAPATRPADEPTLRVVLVKVLADGRYEVDGLAVDGESPVQAIRAKLEPDADVRVTAAKDVTEGRVEEVIRNLAAAGIEASVAEVPAEPSVEDRIAALRGDWERAVLPRADALREAAQVHYELMQAYQDEINRLVDEADRLRREMDILQERFDDLTTPRPMGTGGE